MVVVRFVNVERLRILMPDDAVPPVVDRSDVFKLADRRGRDVETAAGVEREPAHGIGAAGLLPGDGGLRLVAVATRWCGTYRAENIPLGQPAAPVGGGGGVAARFVGGFDCGHVSGGHSN